MKKLFNKLSSSKLYLASVTSLISIIILTIGYFYIQNISDRIYKQKYDELSAITELKVNQLAQWISERNSEAKFFSENPTYIENTIELIRDIQNRDAKESLQKGLSHIQDQHGYENIFIVSSEEQILFSLDGKNEELGTTELELIDSSLSNNIIVFSDFYLCDISNKYHLDIIAPVKSRAKELIAAMVFRFDPQQYLYPSIHSWPLPSKTSEALLVRQVKDSVEFISELRHIKNKPHSIKISLNDSEVPAVQAILGYEGIWEGLDYRNEKVIADIRPLDKTNWFMIAKVDKDEILSELYSSYAYIVLFSFFIILFISALAAFIYAYRKSIIYKDLLETEEEFKTTLYSIGDAVITTDKRGNVKYLNQIAQKLTGWSEKEAKGRKLEDVFNIIDEEKRTTVENPLKKILENGTIEGLSKNILLISKDGNEIPIADSGAPIKDKKGEIFGVVLVFRDITKELKQNTKLIESEKQFRSLYKSIKDAILVTDTERNIIDCNDAFSDIFGYSLEEIKGKKTLSVYENEDQYKELGKAIKEHYGDKPFNYTVNYKRKDGSIFPGETGVFYLRDNEGNITGFIGVIRDVTERKRTEEELFHQKNLMQYVIEHANSAVAVHDKNLRYIYVSKVYLQQYGIKDENILGRHHYEVFPDLPQKWRDVHQRVLNGEIVSSEKDSYERENGTVEWTRWECRPWYENDGSIGGIIIYTELITERIEEEQKLIQSEKRFKSIVEGAPDPIFIQTDMKFAYLNPAACELFGIDNPDELIGKPVMERFHPDYYPKIKDRINRLNNKKEPVEQLLEQKFIRVDGSEVWVETAGEPITYEGKNGALVFVRDVSQRKEADKVQAELYELLDKSLNEIYLFNSDDFQFIYANTGALKNIGYSLQELLQLTTIDIKPNFTKGKFLKLIEPLANGEKDILIIETLHQRKDGTTYPVEIYLQLHRLEEKKLYLAIINDITERKRNEEALRESEERWKFAIEGAGDGLWDWYAKTNEVYFSKQWKSMLGYDDHEITNDLSEWSKRVHKDDLEKATDDLKKHFEGKSDIYVNEHRMLCKDGTYRWILDRGIVISRDNEGKPLRVIGTHKDINEEKINQIKIQQITELNQLAYNAAGLGIWRHDIPSGEIILDERARKYYDVENDKIAMEKLLSKIHPDDIERLSSKMDKVINPNSDGKTTIEYRVIHKDGKVHWLLVNTRIDFEVNGESKKPIFGYGTVADITERKETENNLRKLKDELALQVEAKTKELQERISELERFRDATIDRELRMKELREEIKRLKGKEK